MGKSKFYVVWNGHTPGIYNSWAECQLQIKGYPSAKYKSFKTKEQAESAFKDHYEDHYGKKAKVNKSKIDFSKIPIIKKSISVDAACSGNPGVMEYRGVVTTTGEEIFRKGPYKYGTNNVGEFLALVHALAFLEKGKDKDTAIYTDSRTALSWLSHQRVKTTLKKNKTNEVLFKMMDRAVEWIKTHEWSRKIIKWDTKNWGEIPADFGRK
jgi:ribonuclease HI